MGSFVRRVKTASGATAVQIVHKRGRIVDGIDHIGSAHDADQLALLEELARERLHAGQQVLEFDTRAAGWVDAGTAVVEATSARLLWQALDSVYEALGFTVIRDEAFRALVMARIVEPTSKLDTVRVLGELGVNSPSRVTFMRCLKRSVARDYRELISQACFRHATRTTRLRLALYDVTTLYFETPREDTLRKVGMSKERRVDPQVTVGLLTDGTGFPLAVHLFEGNKAETKTLIPVLTGFRDAHPDAAEIIVVADAGMLSAANLLALEEAGFRFIVGSKISKAPYDLADHLERHGNAFDDGQTIETTRTMGTGKAARSRRVVYQWRFARYRHDIQAINAMIDRAEAVAAGKRPLKKDRFVKLTDTDPVVDWDLVERARYAAGLKGYADLWIMPIWRPSVLVRVPAPAGSTGIIPTLRGCGELAVRPPYEPVAAGPVDSRRCALRFVSWRAGRCAVESGWAESTVEPSRRPSDTRSGIAPPPGPGRNGLTVPGLCRPDWSNDPR